MSSPSPEIQAIEKLASRKFHRIFTTPVTDEHGPLKVSYGIAGVDVGEGDDILNIFVCGGMFGKRHIAPWFDWLAGREGVRMICIDRFVLPFLFTIVSAFQFQFIYILMSLQVWHAGTKDPSRQ